MPTHDLAYQLQSEALKRQINAQKLQQSRLKLQSEKEKTKQSELDVPEQRFKTQSKRHSLKIAELQVGIDAETVAQKRIDAIAAPMQTRLHGQLTALQLGNAALDVAEARQLLSERRQLLVAQGFSFSLPSVSFGNQTPTSDPIDVDAADVSDDDPIQTDWDDWTASANQDW